MNNKPGGTRLALTVGILFTLALVAIIGRVVQSPQLIEQSPAFLGIVGIVIGAIVGNLDRILGAFFPKA